MLYSFCYLFTLFIIYSIIGYVTEIIDCSILENKLVLNRGFLIGPYIPIYGVSCILMIFLLSKYEKDIIVLFVMSVVLCSIVEFITSYILEKIFKVRWWDYSEHKFNLDGRVCLLNSLLFGLGGVLLIHFLNPFITKILNNLNSKLIIIIGILLIVIFIVDLTITIVTLCKIKISTKKFENKDVTDEVKKLVEKTLKEGSFFVTRLLNAFPKITGKNVKVIVTIKKLSNEIRKKIKKDKTSH